jgi:hypothetical protein
MNIPFRRFLKYVLKNAQKLPLHQIPGSLDYPRDQYINSQLIPQGLWAQDFRSFSHALMDLHKTRGRTFRRIGNAAKKHKQVVDILYVAAFIEDGRDVRKIPFFIPIFLKTPQETILWKVWPAKPAERKIGVQK